MRTSLAPLFFVGELFLLLLVRGEGKCEGAGVPHCAPGRTIQHTAPRAAVPKYSIVYASASRSAMHTPVDVTGIEPATACLQSPGLSTFDHTLRFFFPDYRLGNLTQWRADGRPVAGLVPAILGVHAPSRQLTRALPPASPADRAASATLAGVADELGEDIPNSPASVTARATSATLALYAFGDDSHHLPAPSRGKKERKLF